ncbi:hypothetical protein BGZ70_009685 [Mortierella alpina]|uniref:Uncharacterized protein n=1 Tax=Mortierella alpina TaxID=64518 RepID=A0A9P6J0S2_MORAP|nr:hypothetical protein BGZ70_009685 [Mortierella alpina]
MTTAASITALSTTPATTLASPSAVTVMEARGPTRRRFSTPLNFQRRRAASIVQPARVATLQTTAMTALTEDSRLAATATLMGRESSCALVEITSPTAEVTQNALPSLAPPQQNGYHQTTVNARFISQTATGSYFDSVSDDESDTEEEEILQRTVQRPATQSAPLPYPRHSRPVQQQESYGYGTVDNTDTDADEESERDETDDDDDDEDDDDEDDEDNNAHGGQQQGDNETQERDLIRARYSWRSVNPQTLEGYEHQFDDAPPPSYHSLTRSDPHATSSESSPSALQPSSLLPQPMLMVSALPQLLDLLHEFEEHLQDSFRTASFRRPASPDALTTTVGAAANGQSISRRQSWLARHPQTVVSFAYLLIELEQTGILPTAMCASWTGRGVPPLSTPATSATSGAFAAAARPSTLMLTSTQPTTTTIIDGSTSIATTEQEWLALAGNASTEMQLAKAMLALEQSCVFGMDPERWHGHVRRGDHPTGRATAGQARDRWIARVHSISAFA